MTYKTTAVFNGKYYHHFGIHPVTAALYGDKVSDIVEVELTIAEDQSLPDEPGKLTHADYWGWFDHDKQNFSLIYPQRFLLNMCFPNGMKIGEELLRGKAYRLNVKPKN